ncbi:MAG: hypothetical protein COV79_03400 [Parcubacteria group bacterium CG11_big_fil_rev_8_21_14_0_20_41_14]|nr:MAG: hypothetical protein COV79_03400 [Parcubacteria group bacterium CG11_big_fil_rev_8_21_14_0_20_41_14]PIR57400.1 MAG: hypothetical protein COU72_01145 [Parcubacteria group bacterium CG10_big_fil_rev_8_21_14_0_10_41_35]
MNFWDDSESDPAAGSDKAADESGRFAPSGLVAGADDSESGRFAPSGLVAGADDSGRGRKRQVRSQRTCRWRG